MRLADAGNAETSAVAVGDGGRAYTGPDDRSNERAVGRTGDQGTITDTVADVDTNAKSDSGCFTQSRTCGARVVRFGRHDRFCCLDLASVLELVVTLTTD